MPTGHTLLLQSGQTLHAHGAGRVIGGLHMQLAALRGASDGDGRPGGRRPRPYALCCVEMQLPIHPLLGHYVVILRSPAPFGHIMTVRYGMDGNADRPGLPP
jgi:hypothetical protein